VKQKSPLLRFLYWARDLRSRALFEALRTHCRGEVLDVGGWDFFLTAQRERIAFDRWTTLESDPERMLDAADSRVSVVHGDGCAMDFPDGRFDTVLNVQVLEHVFEPIRMVEEMSRVLRPGGALVMLVPQTSTTHLAPHYYANYSRYWIETVLDRAGLEEIEIRPLGGVWSSAASHFLFFFMQATRVSGMTSAKNERNLFFFALFPFMALYALASIPLCLVLALGDLTEEPNNHLVIARKPK
jgi:SAM-dependent methyltransferase